VRFNGGATHTLHVPLPKPAWLLRQTPPEVVAEVDRLLADHTDAETADQLNRHGMLSGEGKSFSRLMVRRIRIDHQLTSRYFRLRTRGLLTLHETARCLDVSPATVLMWRRAGLLTAHRYDDRGQHLYERPGVDAPVKFKHMGKTLGKSEASAANTNSTH
jgi:hypothetical protein